MNERTWIETANGGAGDTLSEICSDIGIDTTGTELDLIVREVYGETADFQHDAHLELDHAIEESLSYASEETQEIASVDMGLLVDHEEAVYIQIFEPCIDRKGKSYIGLSDISTIDTGDGTKISFTIAVGPCKGLSVSGAGIEDYSYESGIKQ